MRLTTATLFASVLLLVAANVRGQNEWPEHTDPGIEFWKWSYFTSKKVEWIREHHLKSVTRIAWDGYRRTFDTLIWRFSASNDTSILSLYYMNSLCQVNKYDKRDSVISIERFGSQTGKASYDAKGRVLFDSIRYAKGTLRILQDWKYNDTGLISKQVGIYYDNPEQRTVYFNTTGAVDSVIFAEPGLFGVLKGYYIYNERNQLVSSREVDSMKEQVDSLIYDKEGKLTRALSYNVGKYCHPICMCQEHYFDFHENLVKKIYNAFDRHGGCGLIDTVTYAYEYDAKGRPTKRVTTYSPTNVFVNTYVWNADNTPASVFEVNFERSGLKEQYTYEF